MPIPGPETSFLTVWSSKAYRQPSIATRCANPQDSEHHLSMYLQEHASSSGAWDGGLPFHPARHRPTNKAYQRRSAVTRSGLPQDHISYHGTFNVSLQGLEEEKHEENGAELTVQQRSPMRPVSLTHVTLQISNTIQLHEQLHQLPLVAGRNTFNVESGNRKRQPPFPSIVPRYHLIRTPLRDTSRIPHVIGRYTGHHPAGRRKRKPQGYLTSDKRDTRVSTMASPLPPRHATEYFPHRQQQPHRSSLVWWV